MQVNDALELADEWIKGMPPHESVQGGRVACATLAAEVRRLRAHEASSQPWHIGFHNEIADMLRPTGNYHPDMVRYQVVQICAHDGRHVAWACSPEHANLIVEAVNKIWNA